MARNHRGEDATVWIGYADFLTTLAVLFLVLIIGIAAKNGVPRAGTYAAIIVDTASRRTVSGCTIVLGEIKTRSGETGRFTIKIDSLRAATTLSLAINCPRYDDISRLATLYPGRTRAETVYVSVSEAVRVRTLPGDALFDPMQFVLKPDAVQKIVALGRELRENLGQDIIAVQGHTDEQPFSAGSDRDNWMLSGERAASAAKILTDSVGISHCQVVIMGFGPSRPVDPITGAEGPDERRAKRARNRRIEFRQLRGRDIGGSCAR